MTEIDGDIVHKAVENVSSEDIARFTEFDSGRARTVLDVELDSGEHLILYLCTKQHVEERFKKEEKLIELVDEKTDIPTPNIIYSDFSKDEVPYLFYIGEKVEGYDPSGRYKYLPKDERMNVLRQSARYLAELHENVKFDGCGDILYREEELEIESSSFYEYLEEWAEEWIEKMGDTRFSDLQEKARDFMEEHKELAENSETCCVHFDFRPPNIIVKEGDIQAVLDWEKAISGAPEWDLQYSMVLMVAGEIQTQSIRDEMYVEFFQAYLDERDLKEDWRKRLGYFNMIWTFKGMAKFEETFTEDDKKYVEQEFRDIFDSRREDLEKAFEEQFPEELNRDRE